MTLTFKIMQVAFESEFYPQLKSGNYTDDPALRFCAQLVRHTRNEEWIETIVRSGFPVDYDGDTFEQIPSKIRRAMEKYPLASEEKPSQQNASQKLLQLFEESGCRVFRDAANQLYMQLAIDQDSPVLPLYSATVENFLKRIYYKATSAPISENALKQVIGVLAGIASFEGDAEPTYLRVAEHNGAVVVNLADEQGRVVIIDEEGYEILSSSPVNFIKSRMMGELPEPRFAVANATHRLFEQLGLDGENMAGVIAYLLNCLNPKGPYFALMVVGEQGSGKSVLCQLIKRIIDPSPVSRMQMPKSIQDLMIHAKNGHLLLYDNLSGMLPEMADAFCVLATGGGYASRQLYTDSDMHVLEAMRPVILNGINEVTKRPDLLERCIYIQLPALPKGTRKTEKEIEEIVSDLLPSVLDELYKAVSAALRNRERVDVPSAIRMADAAHWIAAAEAAMGYAEGELVRFIEAGQQDLVLQTTVNDPLCLALKAVAARGVFEGLMEQLFKDIYNAAENTSVLPKSSSALSNAITRHRQAYEKAGLDISPPKRTNKGSFIRIELMHEAPGSVTPTGILI